MYRTLLDIALGIRYLHDLGIVHGDLKPANVLLKSTVTDARGFTAKCDVGLSLGLEAYGQVAKIVRNACFTSWRGAVHRFTGSQNTHLQAMVVLCCLFCTALRCVGLCCVVLCCVVLCCVVLCCVVL